jgi:DNA-binding LacI/PurR family transcriptional regulator
MLQQYSVDGVVVASSTLPPSFAEAFRAAGIPVVHSFGRLSNAPKVHVVGIDNVACGRMAAQTLISKGYKHIGFMGGPQSATSTQDRLAGFADELAQHSNVAFTQSFAEAYSFDAGRREMLRLISEGPAEAYFCGDDVVSIGALSAIQDSGLSVPEDIGIIGLNDMEMAGWENIGLTTIRQPIQEIVTSSVELVVAMLGDPDRLTETRIFPCELVERKTLRS